MAARYSKGVPVKLSSLFLAALLPQLAWGFCQLLFSQLWAQNAFLREILPVIYLATTYLQWLLIAIGISLKAKHCRVPVSMHLPHFLSFLPLVRHILLAADRQGTDPVSLNYAWLHSLVTHCLTLPACWLWQMRATMREDSAVTQRLLARMVYILAALVVLAIYAGLDFQFVHTVSPLALGLLQFALFFLATLLFIMMQKRVHPLPIIAATVFAGVNCLLLCDRAGSIIRVEFALGACSMAQLFALFVFATIAAMEKRSYQARW